MKKLFAILFSVISMTMSASAVTTFPSIDDSHIVIENSEVSFTIKGDLSQEISTSFDEQKEFFTIETQSTINFLQVVNEQGEVEYQLPIGGKVLKLAITDFDKGTFQINLLVEGENNFITTELVKKN